MMTALTTSPNRRFALHYAEMVLAMVLGMVVLGLPAGALMTAAGTTMEELKNDAPALALLGMALTMTVPMVAWMRFRGHGWAPSMEMAASMLVPTAGAIALLGAGAVEDIAALLTIQHVVMLPAMLFVMLLRRDEYSHDHAAHGPVTQTA